MPRKKDVTESMIDIFSDFQDNKKIGRTTLVGVLEERASAVCWPRCSEAMKTLTLS